jgi:hypothetical protein
MAAPTSADLADFVGTNVTTAQGEAVLSVVTALCKSYTRGGGFDEDGVPLPDIRAVILTASARLLKDPSQIVENRVKGPFSVTYRAGFDGWSVAELATLNRYRVRAL